MVSRLMRRNSPLLKLTRPGPRGELPPVPGVGGLGGGTASPNRGSNSAMHTSSACRSDTSSKQNLSHRTAERSVTAGSVLCAGTTPNRSCGSAMHAFSGWVTVGETRRM